MAQYKNQGDAQMNLVEELSEVMQVITKKVRFNGEWSEVPPGHTKTRFQSLQDEMDDVITAYSRLIDEVKQVHDASDNYVVYMPFGGAMNHRCERGVYEYTPVHFLNAKSLSDVFAKCQNHIEEYSKLGIRSLSVGDIIYSVKDKESYMIKGDGYYIMPPTVLQYIDWSNHPEVRETVLEESH
jgi:hypothetical protein